MLLVLYQHKRRVKKNDTDVNNITLAVGDTNAKSNNVKYVKDYEIPYDITPY